MDAKSHPTATSGADVSTNRLVARAAGAALKQNDESGELSPAVIQQIAELQREKTERTGVQRRINSNLLLAVRRENGETEKGTEALESNVKRDATGRVLVDIKAAVSAALTNALAEAGAQVVNSFPEYESVRAWVPLSSVENLASVDAVRFIRPAVPARTHAGVKTSEGDVALQADLARAVYGVTGAGVKIGVLSDSVDYLSTSQSAGELGAVTVLPNQRGSGNGEGTAMLEIIHDLAPGAALYFATADGGEAAFANNIKALRKAGCDIIVDDVGYLDEPPFQDGIVAQAVNTVTAGGALYFSAAGNSGNKRANQSGTWEGDFAAGDAYSGGGTYHTFGGSKYNTISNAGTQSYAALFWSDALGKSANDYDIYIVSSSGQTVVARSDDYQDGSADPVEFVDTVRSGQKIVVVLSSGEPRFLHIDTGDAELAFNTDGNVRGHPCAADAFCVAAMSVKSATGSAFLGGLSNPLESFSSDGPRRVFYTASGAAITPGDFMSTGGSVRQKPDITGADGVTTSVPGFAPFYGTSAAAPHAAAVAALLKSYKTNFTTGEIRNALLTSALDVSPSGRDETSGAGITMALSVLQAVNGQQAAGNSATLTVANEAGNLMVSLDAAVAGAFALEASPDLATWTSVKNITNSAAGTIFQQAMGTGNTFFRLRALP